MSEQPFDGVTVVELAQWVFVPVAGALLADWGADVIHIEPTEGDPYRALATQGIGTDRGGVNLSLALANRGKRSIALNVKTEEGRAVLHRLLASADVFLTNMRPGALQRLGLDPETLTDRYPALVCANGNGYGVRGPDADRPGYDATAYWARGGMAHMLTPPDRRYPIGQRGRWATGTAPWRWPSGCRRRCSSAPGPGRGPWWTSRSSVRPSGPCPRTSWPPWAATRRWP